eukprot:jgi/Chlat1/3363/Chrsp23S00269
MTDLADQMETEAPQHQFLSPKTLPEFACIYVRYLQIVRKLEDAYDQMVHPQKRKDIKVALEAAIGRMLEVRAWMIHLNKGNDFVQLDDLLVDLKLTPDVLEIPIPRYYIEDRAQELESRDRLLEALLEKYAIAPYAEHASASASPMGEDEAIRLIQLNERGRQGRERARIMRNIREQQEQELRLQRMGGEGALTTEKAALRIQSAVRGFLARARTRKMSSVELVFIGMKHKPRDPATDPLVEHQAEYDQALQTLKQKVRDTEGQDMRETIQDKINAWLSANNDPETGVMPSLPSEEAGGSRTILFPNETGEGKEGAGGVDGKAGGDDKGDAKGETTTTTTANTKTGGKSGSNAKGTGANKDKDKDEAPVVEENITAGFVSPLQESLSRYSSVWESKDETSNFAQHFDSEMVKAQMRPEVFEEMRREVDDEMRVLLNNLKEMVAAERDAKKKKGGGGKKGKKGAKKEGGGKKEKKEKKEPKEKKEKKEKGGGKKKGGKKDKKGKKDPTHDRSIESLYAELVSAGLVVRLPVTLSSGPPSLAHYLGAPAFIHSVMEKSGTLPDLALAQVRQAVAQSVSLPLGLSPQAHAALPAAARPRAVLLYGAQGTGKSLLAMGAAREAAAAVFDISPARTNGKYSGKTVTMMLHIVFKVAKAMAPSIIYINDAERVFVSDKKKARAYGLAELPSRIKKDLLKEVSALQPTDRVVVVGASRRPYECASASDSKAFVSFFETHIPCPIPNYASLRCIWPGLISRYAAGAGGGYQLPEYSFDLSTLCTVSLGYTTGDIEATAAAVLTARRVAKLRAGSKPLSEHELITALSKLESLDTETDNALRC